MDEILKKIELNTSNLLDIIDKLFIETQNKDKIINELQIQNDILVKQLYDLKTKPENNIENRDNIEQHNYYYNALSGSQKSPEIPITLNKTTKDLIKKYIRTIDRCIHYIQENTKERLT